MRRVRWAVTTDTVGGSGQMSRGGKQLRVDVSDAASLSRRIGVPGALLDVGVATAEVVNRGLVLLAEACGGSQGWRGIPGLQAIRQRCTSRGTEEEKEEEEEEEIDTATGAVRPIK